MIELSCCSLGFDPAEPHTRRSAVLGCLTDTFVLLGLTRKKPSGPNQDLLYCRRKLCDEATLASQIVNHEAED
jgi:hypothetical protein